MATSIGRYEILRQIGAGGSADVYEALDTQLNRPVALKILKGDNPQMVERLHREAAAAAQLRHPNIVAVHDVGEEGGSHYIAMDFIPGSTLAEARRHMTLRRRTEVLLVISRAVAFAHQHGIIHRDLKPHNILIDASSGTPFLSDFGLAKLEHSNALTRTGAALGTPYYMAPEQVLGLKNQIGPHTDVWALGVILYELIADHPPFSAATPVDVYSRILSRDPAALRGAPSDLQTIAFKALEKEPAKRYRTAEAFANDLDRHLKGQSILVKPPSFASIVWRRVKRSPVPSSLMGALVVAMLVIACLVVAQERRARSLALQHAEEAAKIIASVPEKPASKEARQAALQDLIRADHLLQLARRTDFRYDVNRRLGDLALDGSDFALARLAFSTCRSLRPDENLEPLVVEREQADLKKRKARLEEILDDLRQGLSRPGRPPGAPLLEDFVFEAVQFSDEQTVQVLAEVLKPMADKAQKDALWSQEERDLMTFAFRVLGRLDRDSAVAPLARMMDGLSDTALAVNCGLALCNTRRTLAEPALLRARERLNASSESWRQIADLLSRIPKAAADDPVDALSLYQRGLIHLDRGEVDRALSDFSQAIDLGPDYPAAYNSRGLARAQKGDVDGAIEDYTRALQIDPGYIAALANRGSARHDRRDLDGALEDLSQVIALEPDVSSHYGTRAVVRRDRGDLDGAIEDGTRAIALDPRSINGFNNRAIARRYKGDLPGALEDFTRAMEFDPRNGMLVTNRGNVWYALKDFDRAIADHTRAIELDPTHPNSYSNRGNALCEKGRFSDAIPDYNRAIVLNPRHVNAYVNRGRARKQTGDFDGAIADYDRALEIDARSAATFQHRADVHKARGDLDGALADLTRAIELGPASSEAYLNRGAVRHAKGDFAGAAEDWERFLNWTPGHPQAAQVRALLLKARSGPQRNE